MCSAISKIGLSLSGLMTVCQFGVYKFVAVVHDEDVDDEDEDEVEDDCFVNDNVDAIMIWTSLIFASSKKKNKNIK